MRVEGVRETVTALRSLEPKLARAAIADVKSAAEPARASVAAAVPTRPLSGMIPARPRAVTRYGGRATATSGGKEYPLVRVALTGPRWSVAGDMAARGHSPRGRSWVAALTARYGGTSRWVWPAVETHRAAVGRAVETAARSVSDTLTRELRR